MEKPFGSPTTPGLAVTFKNYLIELVCLNCDKRISARFWKSNSYWSKKYVREIKGVHNLSLLIDFENLLNQKLIIQIIKDRLIKSLTAKKTLDRIVFLMKKEEKKEEKKIDSFMSNHTPEVAIDMEKNSRFIDVKKKDKFSSIREIEQNGKE